MAEAQHGGEDGDIIAILSPSDASESEEALEVIRTNIHRLRGPVPGERAQADGDDRLELRFSRGPLLGGSSSFVFGTAETCDIVLPKINGISKRHCALTFEKVSPGSGEYRLAFRNLSKCKRTCITYNTLRKHPDTCEGASWIVNSQGFPYDAVSMGLAIHKRLRFRITVGQHSMVTPSYIARIEPFLRGAQDIEDGFRATRLNDGPATVLVSQAPSPDDDCMFIIVDRKEHHADGPPCVSRVLEVSTGMPFAGKHLSASNSESLRGAAKIWQKLSHARILQFKGIPLLDSETEMAITEFCGDFNIATSAKEQPLAHNDIAGLIKQVSEGLEYLHNKDMAHGNLKPSNILVRTRQPLDVAIGDVGTPGNNEWLRQPHYLAPEIVPSPGQERGQEQGRDARPADVWALGVITLEVLEGSMLSMENAYRYPYNVSRHVSKSRRPPGSEAALIILIQGMLKNNPKNRLTATECRKEAEALLRSLAAAFPDQNCAVARGADENPGADQNDRAGRVSEMGNGKEVDRGKDIDGGKELDKASGSGGAMTDGITGGSGDNTPGPSKAIARRQSKRKSATTPNQNRAPSPKRHLRSATNKAPVTELSQ